MDNARFEQHTQDYRLPFFFFFPSTTAPAAWTRAFNWPVSLRARISETEPTGLPPMRRIGREGVEARRVSRGMRTLASPEDR